jgi:phage terminase small subunit
MALNEKQEKFAQSYILHRNATEAAKAAGYAAGSAANQGYRLINNDEVAERVRELENELETNVDVIEEIESQYTFARANGHTNSALKALELLSRVRGNNSELDTNLDEKSLEDGIVQCLNILGADKVYSLLEKCDFVEDIEEEEENTTEIE